MKPSPKSWIQMSLVATSSRDTLAKIVYSRLFDWLVDTINSSIGQDPNSKYLIGVLDIYGFESFKTNRCLTECNWCSRLPDNLSMCFSTAYYASGSLERAMMRGIIVKAQKTSMIISRAIKVTEVWLWD